MRNQSEVESNAVDNLAGLELPDIIDIKALQSLMDDFQKLTGMVFAILDLKGGRARRRGLAGHLHEISQGAS